MTYGGHLLRTRQYAAYYGYCSTLEPELVGMLSTSEKIGDDARCWNLPLSTCVGASAVCRGRCYYWKMLEGRADIPKRAEKNRIIADRADFPELVAGAIEVARVRCFRVHDIGDFYSGEYLAKWARVAELCPSVSYWAYTRAWRVRELLAPLAELASRSNFSLLLSGDRETGFPPTIKGTRIAWLADTDGDAPPAYAHVVFRAAANRKTEPLPRLNGAVCPNQNGSGTFKPCIACEHCIKKFD